MITDQEQENEQLRIENEVLKTDCESKTETVANTIQAMRAIESQHSHEFPCFNGMEYLYRKVTELGERIRAKQNNPSLTKVDLDRMVPSTAEKELAQTYPAQIQGLYRCLELDPGLAEFFIKSSKEVQEQAMRVKKLIRESLLRSHYDKNTVSRSKAVQESLESCCKEIIDIRSKIHFHPLYYHLNENEIKKLEAVSARIKQILSRAGINDNTDMPKQTREERMEFLKAEIAGYEAVIEELNSKIYCLLNSDRLNILRAHLGLSDELKEELNQQIANKIVGLKAKQDQLEEKFKELFASKPGTCDTASDDK